MTTQQSPEPAQGTVETGTQYRDRPSDDGKYGDGADQPRPDAAKEDAQQDKKG
jgi:hypothetical protein